MNSPLDQGGVWAYMEFIDGKPVNGEAKVTDVLHGSVSPSKQQPGQLFQLAVVFTDYMGFVHQSVPNACVIQ